MALTDSLRRQHRAVSLLTMRLRELVEHYRGGTDDYRVTLQLARLHSLLRRHLLEEDGALYPALLGSRDDRVTGLAREMQAQNGCLAENFEQFMVRWSSSALIGSSFATFRAELHEVLDALDARIEREEFELYPLADRLADRGQRRAA